MIRHFGLTLFFLCSAAPSAQGQAALSYPYLDGGEAALPRFRALAEKTSSGYVRIVLMARPDRMSGTGGGRIHTGSGIVLNAEGYILSAAHIVRGAQFDVHVYLRDGRRVVAEVIKVAPKNDLALIKIPPQRDLVPLPLGRSAALKKGEPALAIGSPRDTWGVVTIGPIRSPNIKERLDYNAWGFDNAVEIGMEVETGHSGGPVVNARGEVIGMIAGYEMGDTRQGRYVSPRIAYAVPADDIRKFLGW